MSFDHSALPKLAAIHEAQEMLSRHLSSTPLVPAASLSGRSADVVLKNETVLPTHSFKPRGAMYALAKNLERGRVEEVVASSTGNHGAAVAFAGRTLGVPVTIFLPENPNPVKQKNIEGFGARIVFGGCSDLVGASQLAKEYSRRPGVYFLHDARDPDLPAGAGTIGLEILQQLPDASAVFVPMGDTALIRGIAAAVKAISPSTRVIGVQAERAPSYVLSWRAGKPVPTESCDTCADGLATRMPEAENVAAIRDVVDDVVLVSEEQMLAAVHHLYVRENVLAEPSGAAATAGYLANPVEGRIVLLVSGGNITDELRRRAGIGH
jgi:threonine dehydratase